MSKLSQLRLPLHCYVSKGMFSAKIAIAAGLVAAAPLAAYAASGPIVDTKEGPVQGFLANDGVVQFLGIPYAAPPIGNLRWRPPVAHAAWTKVLKATAFGPQCAQTQGSPFSGPPNNNEDCL